LLGFSDARKSDSSIVLDVLSDRTGLLKVSAVQPDIQMGSHIANLSRVRSVCTKASASTWHGRGYPYPVKMPPKVYKYANKDKHKLRIPALKNFVKKARNLLEN
jgi:hypothetical protein